MSVGGYGHPAHSNGSCHDQY